MAVWYAASVGGRLISGVAGSNPAEGLDVCLLCLLCVGWVASSATGCSLAQKESYRLCVCVCVCVLPLKLNNEAAYVRFGLIRHIKIHSTLPSYHKI